MRFFEDDLAVLAVTELCGEAHVQLELRERRV